MKQLIIDEKKAKMLFPKADEEFKGILKASFGEELFSQKNIDRIKTFEDACHDLDLDPGGVLPYPRPASNARQIAANAFAMLDIITEALLEGVKLDWTNDTQKKWYPWFNNYKPGSGFRFGDSGFVWADTYATGGARLCVDTQEKAQYLGTQFIDIWNKFLNPNK